MIIYLNDKPKYWEDRSEFFTDAIGKTVYLKSTEIVVKKGYYNVINADIYINNTDGWIRIIFVKGQSMWSYRMFEYSLEDIKNKVPGINRDYRGLPGSPEAFKIAKEYVRTL